MEIQYPSVPSSDAHDLTSRSLSTLAKRRKDIEDELDALGSVLEFVSDM